MGFHKRYLDIDTVIKNLENNNIVNLFTRADALIFEDDESSYAYALFTEGKTNNEILEILKNTNNENN
jgi:beta-galactosidase beta subunit